MATPYELRAYAQIGQYTTWRSRTPFHNTEPAKLLQSEFSRSHDYRDPPGLQSISLPRFPLHVDRRVYVQYRHLDAESRAELAHLHAHRFQVSPRPGPGPQRSADLSF